MIQTRQLEHHMAWLHLASAITAIKYKYNWLCTHALPHSSTPALAAAAARASLATIRVQAARLIAMAARAALLLAVSLVLAAVVGVNPLVH